LHEFVIRRNAWLRPCFGLKTMHEPTPATRAATA